MPADGSGHPEAPAVAEGVVLAAALAYAEAGLPVFPCSHDKKPIIKAWPTEASTDPVRVREWWGSWPTAMIGLVTGARSGLYVVDIDVEGMGAYLELAVPKAEIAVRTPSGGGHAYYRWPGEGWGNTASRIVSGVDTRGEGGYVIAPPSADGGYFWGNETMCRRLLASDVPDLPEPLLAMLAPAVRPPAPSAAAPAAQPRSAGRWAATALREEVARVQAAVPGQRNHTLNRAAFKLGQIVADGQLDRAEVEAALLAGAIGCGLAEGEAEATIRSGLAGGSVHPRGPKPAEGSPSTAGPAVSGGAAEAEADTLPEPNWDLLRRTAAVAPELPIEVFGPAWAEWIVAGAEAAAAPPDYVAMGLLAIAGSLIGNSRWVSPWEGWQEPPIVWSMIIGAPSSNKSPGLKAAAGPLKRLEKEVRDAAKRELADWNERKKAAEAAWKDWERRAEEAAKLGRPKPARPAPVSLGEEPVVPRLTVADVTTEKLGVILARQPRATLMVRDELAGLFGDMNRYNNGGGDRSFWLQAYGGGDYCVERLGREAVDIDHLSVGVVGGIQPDRLASLLLKAGDDDGMLARFCPVLPPKPPVRIPSRSADAEFALRAYRRLHQLDMRPEGPSLVAFEPAAKSAMNDYRVWLQGVEDEHAGLLKSFAGKTPGMVARIALVLALLDWAAGTEPTPPQTIELGLFERAQRLVRDYLLPMARLAYAEASMSLEERGARAIAQKLQAERIPRTTRSELVSLRVDGLRNARTLASALDLLVDGKILLEDKVPTGGRPRFEYVVNPRVWD